MLQSQDFLGGFYLGQEVGQPGVSRVALGVTRVLPSLLFKLAAAQKEKKYREEKWAVAGGKSGQHGGRLWEPYMGRTGGAHSILLSDGILCNIVYFDIFFL